MNFNKDINCTLGMAIGCNRGNYERETENESLQTPYMGALSFLNLWIQKLMFLVSYKDYS